MFQFVLLHDIILHTNITYKSIQFFGYFFAFLYKIAINKFLLRKLEGLRILLHTFSTYTQIQIKIYCTIEETRISTVIRMLFSWTYVNGHFSTGKFEAFTDIKNVN